MLNYNELTQNSPRLMCSIINKLTRDRKSQNYIDLVMRKRELENELSKASNVPVFELKRICAEITDIEKKLGH